MTASITKATSLQSEYQNLIAADKNSINEMYVTNIESRNKLVELGLVGADHGKVKKELGAEVDSSQGSQGSGIGNHETSGGQEQKCDQGDGASNPSDCCWFSRRYSSASRVSNPNAPFLRLLDIVSLNCRNTTAIANPTPFHTPI